MNKIKTKEELKDALLNVRNAHRLIKEYQEMALNLAYYVKDRYMLTNLTGKQRFCDPLSHHRSGDYANIKLRKEMWSWDFLYTYEFEYYFGESSTRFTDKVFSFSIIQVSDTGCYKADVIHSERNEINKFTSTDESESVFIFIFEIKGNDDEWIWNNEIEKAKEHLLTNNNLSYDVENRFFAKKYDIFEFIDQENSNDKLLDFNNEIEKQFQVSLLKK